MCLVVYFYCIYVFLIYLSWRWYADSWLFLSLHSLLHMSFHFALYWDLDHCICSVKNIQYNLYNLYELHHCSTIIYGIIASTFIHFLLKMAIEDNSSSSSSSSTPITTPVVSPSTLITTPVIIPIQNPNQNPLPHPPIQKPNSNQNLSNQPLLPFNPNVFPQPAYYPQTYTPPQTWSLYWFV